MSSKSISLASRLVSYVAPGVAMALAVATVSLARADQSASSPWVPLNGFAPSATQAGGKPSVSATVKSASAKSPGKTAGRAVAAPGTVKVVEKIQFNHSIRPILSDNCFLCHGPDKARRKAGLRLDDRAVALSTGAIVPGDPDKSELIKRISSTNPDDKMPPDEAHKTLTVEQKATLRQWIAEGAEYQPLWSFIPPRKVALPKISNPGWAKNPIDNFIMATLDKQGLKPAPATSKEELLRRVSFDLTGLPPTPAELDAFLADKSPQAYEKVVDRLLLSPRYGEHMAVYWLDAARYADTHGLHFDNERAIWPYRDWVVQAYNDNLPYDQFTIDQLAGDELPHPTRDQLVATGFNRCSPSTNEGGSIDAESLFRYAVDRTTTTSGVFMGLTAGCAVCHDHKFDPITQKEFYQLYAFFNSTADPAMDGNIMNTPPVLRLASATQEAQLTQDDKDMAAMQQKITDTVAKVAYSDPALQNPVPPPAKVENSWMEDSFPTDATPHAEISSLTFVSAAEGPVQSGQRALKVSGAGTAQCFFDGLKTPFNVPNHGTIFAYVYLDPKNPPKSIMLQFNTGDWTQRMNWGNPDAIPFGIKGTPAKLLGGDLPKPGEWTRLEINIADLKLNPGTMFKGIAFTVSDGTAYWDHVGVTYDASPATDPILSQHAWEQNYNGKDPGDPFPQPIRDIFKAKPEERKPAQNQQLRTYYLSEVYSGTRDLVNTMHGEINKIAAAKKKTEAEVPATLIMADLPKPREAHLMLRGQYDKPGDVVEPGTPAVLPPLKAAGRATRLDLAKWLVSTENPLTARVYVNRLWEQCFGFGIVKTAGDFGSQGEPPTHPELLDWLAVEFRDSGWDIKHMMKLIVMSATYQQDSHITPQMHERDPDNRLLAHGQRLRLDAEEIRDNALYVSGLMDSAIGGRGVKPYQPINIWEPLAYPGSDTDHYVQDHGDALYRRSLYTFWKRTAPPPSASVFDAPAREDFCLRRERSNTPLQALVLMNDTQQFEAARALAQRILLTGGATAAERLAYGFRVTTDRYPTTRERGLLQGALDKQMAHFKAQPDEAKAVIANGESKPDPKLDPLELAAYTMVSSLLLNLDETITKN